MLKNRVEEYIEKAVVDLAIDQPALGQLRVSNELKKQGILISPGGVRSIWMRHDLQTFKLRLKALEAKSAQEGIVLTEAQLIALEKAKEKKGTWRNRNVSSWIFRSSGHLLCWKY
ncbi:hypothetical protein HMPREF0765_3601 [Sphingobacterium spiritivorum ATCC 33300]|uniref:Uncharacterized protein n=1 Tax=Sphingobacterium spiritivorum ATCC 33300 TaxID=525372 RepID=C2G1Z5_SPHSI|nr:hypothetical protein HMPREF0765_3601 [Sphingobacterium spiritivorum ATCC 33300]